jgi:hypothetical protein
MSVDTIQKGEKLRYLGMKVRRGNIKENLKDKRHGEGV